MIFDIVNLISVIFILAMGWMLPKCHQEVWVNTNNGVDRKNRDFKNEYLKQHKDKTLSGKITVLLEKSLPDIHNRCYIYQPLILLHL